MARKKKGKKGKKKGHPSSQAEPCHVATPPVVPCRSRNFEYFGLICLLLLLCLIYSNTLSSPFVFDDSRITINTDLHRAGPALWDQVRAGFATLPKTRPVADLTLLLNYHLHGLQVTGYHLVNILIHLMTTVVLYLFVRTLLDLSGQDNREGEAGRGWLALATAAIWAVNPLQSQSVTYIIQRMNSLAALFMLLSLFLYCRARLTAARPRKGLLFTLSALAGLLALGSKEIAATLPVLLFLLEWYFFQDRSLTWLKKRLGWILTGIALLVGVTFLFLGPSPLEAILADYGVRDFTMTERLLTESRVVLYYLGLFLLPLPSRLNLDHDFPLSLSLVEPITTLISLVVITGLLGLAVRSARRWPLLSFCILWYFINLGIESTFIGLEILFEHRLYLPSMLLVLLLLTFLFGVVTKPHFRLLAVCLVVVLFSFWTYERNKAWQSELSLWQDCAAKSPAKARPQKLAGNALMDLGRSREALAYYEEALALAPEDMANHNNMAVALVYLGRLPEARLILDKAVVIEPANSLTHTNLGNILLTQGHPEEALAHYRKAIQLNPDDPDNYTNLGVGLARQGRLTEALEMFNKALKLDPSDSNTHSNMGNVLSSLGRIDEAIIHFTEALRLDPNNGKARRNRDRLLR